MMHPANVHEDLVQVASEVKILSRTCYVFRDDLRDLKNTAVSIVSESGRPMGWDDDGSPLLAFVESELYQRLYRRPLDGIGRSVVAGGADHAFIHRLSSMNLGHGTWEPGWKVVGLSDDLYVGVAKDIVCWVPSSDVRPVGGELRPNVPCRVKVAKELRHLLLGYYLALGNTDPPEASQGDTIIRLYWNTTVKGAVRYIQQATTLLNDHGIPFRTKVVAHPSFYQNADSGVLYLAKRDFIRASTLICQIHQTLASELRPEVPMFTQQLAPGLGLAEDPMDGLSFGQSRCRILARGLWEAHLCGGRSVEERLRALVSSFERVGLDPARPHLRAGSRDIYALTDSEQTYPG